MKKTVFLLLAIISASVVLGQEKQKVAVYVTGAEEGVNEFVGAYLVNSIVSSSDYIAVERTSEFMRELNKEQEYQRTGAVNDDQISQLGKQFGVQLVCMAKVGKVSSQQFVSARLIDVETVTVIKSTKPVLFAIDNIDKTCTSVTAALFNGKQLVDSNIEIAEYEEPVKQEQPTPVYKITDSKSSLSYSGSKVYQNGRRLSVSEVRSRLANSIEHDLYNKGLRQRKSGNILLWTGTGIASVGIILCSVGGESYSYYSSSSYNSYYYEESSGGLIAGSVLTACGTGALIGGIVLKSAGKKKIQRSINQYNNRVSSYSSLQFGATSNGLGFVYNF